MPEPISTRRRNVCTEVVGRGLCIGCGLCAGVCPTGTLAVGLGEFGDCAARDTGGRCGDDCTLCLRVCPFRAGNDDEDELGRRLFAATAGIRHTPETGYALGSFVGYSPQPSHRRAGASGGLATWALENLLSTGAVDRVACVGPSDGPGPLFEAVLCDRADQLRSCAGSCYYPVEFGRIVRSILNEDARYAVIALPCVVKAFRLAMAAIPKLARRVRLLLGLVCGQGKSALFAECVCALAGGSPDGLRSITFRVKAPDRPASDFAAQCTSVHAAGSAREDMVFFSDGPDRLWQDRYFTPDACGFCDDVFAELADAVFMDAWLPPYVADARGHSIVLTRRRELDDVFNQLCRTDQTVQPLPIEDAIRSQAGVVFEKRAAAGVRIAAARPAGLPARAIRAHLVRPCRIDQRAEARLKWRIARKSPHEWIRAGRDLRRFRRRMNNEAWRLAAIRWARRCASRLMGR